ncbi:MAG TPA: TetR/AcrR family transcriptional regulator [Ktedonobacteraceae bacterium]|nr:TetR/AcrR family transcriptional regulator [Ktedonobacteraceae bacterium]
MARIVKEEEYTGKRNAILDVAQRLIYTKGYEQMTIQDMLDDLQISKGAFYHYFDSKQAVLEALVERRGEEALQLLIPIVHDPALPALDKFQRYLDVANRWKVGQKAFFLALLRVWFTDDNAVVRQKLRAIGIREIAPLLSEIIRQGVQEGVMRVSYPDQMGEVMASLAQDAGEAVGALISFDPSHADMQRVERTVAAYTEAFERLLEVPAGSLTLVDDQTLQEWFASPGENEVEVKP